MYSWLLVRTVDEGEVREVIRIACGPLELVIKFVILENVEFEVVWHLGVYLEI